MDKVTAILMYESGALSDDETMELFCDLIKTGLCWSLQGCYGRTAAHLIEAGYITKKGERTHKEPE